MTADAHRSEGRRILAGIALRAPIPLILGALAIPASSLAEVVSLKAGASEVLMETVTIIGTTNRIQATFDGTVVADRNISSGDTLDIETGNRENRVIFDEAEGFVPGVTTLLDMGADADTFAGRVRGDKNVLGLDGGGGPDVWSLHNDGDSNTIRVDGDSDDDIVSLQNRGRDNRFRINGGAGDDYATVSVPGNPPGNSIRANLGAGDDVLRSKGPITAAYDGGPGQDTLSVSGGRPYQLVGGAGNDELTTRGTGRDAVSGGSGNDLIVVLGGGRDTVRCGAGRDRVLVDKTDKVASDCESRVFLPSEF